MKKIIISGNVGNDHEVHTNSKGDQFATFSVAVHTGSKDNQNTEWFNVICNDKKMDFAKQYIKKADKVLIEGYPTAHGYLKENEVHTNIRISNPQIEILSRPVHEEGNNEPQNN